MLSCIKCGAAVTEQAIFCSMCGVRLTEADPEKRPRNQAADALAKASGLNGGVTSLSGRLLRGLAVAAGLLLVGATYLFYRSQSGAVGGPALNLVAPLDKVNQLVGTGQKFLDEGNFPQARTSFEEAARLSPTNTSVLLKLAFTSNSLGDVENAVQTYSKVIDLDPKNVEARLQRADLQLNRGIWKEAYEDLEYLISNAPASEQASRARQILNQFVAQRPADSLTDRRNKRGRKGVQLPEVEQRPARLAVALPQLATDSPRSNPAAGTVDETANADTLARIHKDKGQRYLNTRQYDAAIGEFQIAKRFSPDDPDLYYYLGSAHDGLKQFSQARKYYEQCSTGVYVAVARNAAKTARKNEQDELRKQAKKNQ